MDRVKIFESNSGRHLEESVNEWIREMTEKPEHNSTYGCMFNIKNVVQSASVGVLPSQGQTVYLAITIHYTLSEVK